MNRSARLAGIALLTTIASLTAAQTPRVPNAVFNDPAIAADAADVKITSGFEGSLPGVEVVKRSPSHYTIHAGQNSNPGGYYLLIKLDGVAGRTVQIDFEGSPFNKWGNAVPQFSEAADLAALDSFDAAVEGVGPETQARAAVGDASPELPETSDQHWHFVADCWKEESRTCVRQKFAADSAYVAYKVPYTPTYDAAFLKSLADDANVKVVTVGETREKRPLQVAVVAREPVAGAPPRPGVLIYGREFPDAQDGSWIVQGAMQHLLGDTPEAKALRERCDFICIPVLDPDGAAVASHLNIGYSFAAGPRRSAESTAYTKWFADWLASGHRVDVAISLYGAPPNSNFHMACPQMEPNTMRLDACMALHKTIRDALTTQSYAVRNSPWATGVNEPVISGWLQREYGTLVLPYVANSTQPKSHLKLAQLRQIGATLATSADAFLASDAGRKLMTDVDARRAAAAASRPTTAPTP